MTEFKREHDRYIVIKRKEIQEEDEESLREFLESWQIPTVQCLVIEPDWPIYDQAWDMVQRLAERRPQEVERVRAENKRLISANWELATTNDQLRENVAKLEHIVECSGAHSCKMEVARNKASGQRDALKGRIAEYRKLVDMEGGDAIERLIVLVNQDAHIGDDHE